MEPDEFESEATPRDDANPLSAPGAAIGANPLMAPRPAIGANPLIGTRPAIGANPLIGPRPAIGANPLMAPGAAARRPVRSGPTYRGLPAPVRAVGWVLIAIVVGVVTGWTAPTALRRVGAVAALQPGLLA